MDELSLFLRYCTSSTYNAHCFFFSTFDIAKMAQPNSIKRLIQFSPEINKEKGNPVPKPVFIFVHFPIA